MNIKSLILVASVIALMNPACRNQEAEDVDGLDGDESRETSTWIDTRAVGSGVVLVATDRPTESAPAEDDFTSPRATIGAGGTGSGGALGSGGVIVTLDTTGTGGATRGAGGTASGPGSLSKKDARPTFN